MITAIILGAIVGWFGASVEEKVRQRYDSKWAVLAAFALIGMAVAIIVTTLGFVF